MSIIEPGASGNNVTTNNNNAPTNVHNSSATMTTNMTNVNGMSNVIVQNGSVTPSAAATSITTPILSPLIDEQNPLSVKINELKQQQQQQQQQYNSQFENNNNTSIQRPDVNVSLTTSNTSSKESSRFRIIKTDSDGKNVLDSSSKQQQQQQHQTLINGPSGDSGKIYAQLNGSMVSTSASSFNGSIGSQNSSTMVNAMHNGHSDISIDKQRNANISQHNSNKYQCGRWYVADFGPTTQRQQQNYTQHELDHNVEHSLSTIVKLPLNQTQTHFNPIESTTIMNQQHVFQSNSSQTLVQPTPTIINKTSSTTITTTNTTSLNTTNNNNNNNNNNNLDNTNNGIPQQLQQSLVSNSSNNLNSIQTQQQQVRFRKKICFFFRLKFM
jgi:hypothetical protein